jgi:hypothetical protein
LLQPFNCFMVIVMQLPLKRKCIGSGPGTKFRLIPEIIS